MPKVSVTVITKNEASNITEALRSVAWADEIIVVDAESTDETVTLAQRVAHRVVVHPWTGYGAQKNYAAELASHDWILSLDADERVTDALAAEIRQVLQREPDASGFRLKRVTHHLGRWIRSTDWYPDYQLRLYDRRRGRWSNREVHESVELSGRLASLTQELQHFAYRDVTHHVATINRYTSLAATQMAKEGRRASVVDLAFHPPLAFFRNYVLRRGFSEGVAGLIISAMNSYYVLLKFAKLWEQQHVKREEPT